MKLSALFAVPRTFPGVRKDTCPVLDVLDLADLRNHLEAPSLSQYTPEYEKLVQEVRVEIELKGSLPRIDTEVFIDTKCVKVLGLPNIQVLYFTSINEFFGLEMDVQLRLAETARRDLNYEIITTKGPSFMKSAHMKFEIDLLDACETHLMVLARENKIGRTYFNWYMKTTLAIGLFFLAAIELWAFFFLD